MGCGDACPIYPGKKYEDWELDDPAGQELETVRAHPGRARQARPQLIGELLPDDAAPAADWPPPARSGAAAPARGEFVGTFTLVFAGCGAIMVDAKTHALGHVGVALSFGLVIMAMIYAVGHISGAHFNPAVTFSFALTRHFPWSRSFRYWCGATPRARSRPPRSCAARSATSPTSVRRSRQRSQGQSFLWELVLELLPHVRDHGRRDRHPRRRRSGGDRRSAGPSASMRCSAARSPAPR